jgi:hypothetical protein
VKLGSASERWVAMVPALAPWKSNTKDLCPSSLSHLPSWAVLMARREKEVSQEGNLSWGRGDSQGRVWDTRSKKHPASSQGPYSSPTFQTL